MNIKKYKPPVKKEEIKDIKKEITKIIFHHQYHNLKVYKVEYTDKHFNLNTKYIYQHKITKEIGFTDETEINKKLRTRIIKQLNLI